MPRGHSSTGRSKKLPEEVEEDLLAEVQRLRAENDYLKNLQGKAKGLAACNSQTASPLSWLNNFYFKILSNFSGSLQFYFPTSGGVLSIVRFFWFGSFSNPGLFYPQI